MIQKGSTMKKLLGLYALLFCCFRLFSMEQSEKVADPKTIIADLEEKYRSGRGDASVALRLGECYFLAFAHANDQNESEEAFRNAEKWLSIGARHNLYLALINLGNLYEMRARHFIPISRRKAADFACFPQWIKNDFSMSLKKAEYWFNKAREHPEPINDTLNIVYFQLGRIYNLKAKYMCDSEARNKEYRERAFKFLLQSAEGGYAEAQSTLSDIFEEKASKETDSLVQEQLMSQSLRWLQSAANQNCRSALFSFGLKYAKKSEGTQDSLQKKALLGQAKEYYLRSAQQGDGRAMVNLAALYLSEYIEVPHAAANAQLLDIALDWCTKASKTDIESNIEATGNMGNIYLFKTEIARDKAEREKFFAVSKEHYEKVVVTGDPKFQCNLGNWYRTKCKRAEKPEEKKELLDKSIEWYQKAVDQKFGHAQERIEEVRKELKALFCVACGKLGSKKCSVCKVTYCSKECQVADWPIHKRKCTPAMGHI